MRQSRVWARSNDNIKGQGLATMLTMEFFQFPGYLLFGHAATNHAFNIFKSLVGYLHRFGDKPNFLRFLDSAEGLYQTIDRDKLKPGISFVQ